MIYTFFVFSPPPKPLSNLYAYVDIPVVSDSLVRTKFCLFLQP